MKKAVIYARYSSDRQREESIEGQIRVCEEYARKHDLSIIHTYTDRALTGRTDKRPQFQMMIKDAAKMNFEIVLVYKLNRFARNRYDSARYKHKLKTYGVKLVSAMENIAEDASGILLESVIEGMAEYYSAELSENVLRGMTENVLEGKWPGGVLPYGYAFDANHHLVLDPIRSEAVRIAYRLLLSNHSKKYILNYLNERHYTSVNGGKISYSNLHSMLTNERCTGTMIWRGIRKENAFPAIIDKNIFDKAQIILERRKRNRMKSTNSDFFLTGKLFCGKCGARMIGTSGTSKTKSTYYYYACSKHLKKKCDTKNIRKDVLENAVCSVTTQILADKRAVKAIAKQAVEIQKNKKDSPELMAIEQQISEDSRKLQNCQKAVENGLESFTIANRIKELENNLLKLEKALHRQTLLEKGPELTEVQITFFLESVAKQIKNADKYKRILLTSLIRNVIVYDDYIEVQYNYKDELPILRNTVKIKSSSENLLAEQVGFEPTEPYGSTDFESAPL